MSLTPDLLVSVLYFVWLLIITLLFIRFYSYYTKLSKDGKKDSIVSLLNDISSHQETNKKALDQLKVSYDKLEKDGFSHIQKIGLVRFNPFKDTGGDQSFILALVDSENTGVVISSLHTRTGTRWYAKEVVKGRGMGYELSDDETKALKGARPMGSSQT